ncbi:hypothetical protein TcWFU_004455 [Taenia crassiceps]|uniref:Uncharacterized protein n=1 Tax=Taenia crassiceps TaxID=6207 RepID=A0ABR4QDX6_9CEST
MTFHRRCTLFFLDLFSILALIALGIEIFGPWMQVDNDKCLGITSQCDSCSHVLKAPAQAKCEIALPFNKQGQDVKLLISFVTASVAGCIIAIMTVFAVMLSCGSCCGSSSCSHSMFRFTFAYILFDVLALIANIVAVAMWIVINDQKNFGYSFWVGWAANALLLILLVILIILRRHGEKDDNQEDRKSWASINQVLFRSLYQMTPTTVFHNRP